MYANVPSSSMSTLLMKGNRAHTDSANSVKRIVHINGRGIRIMNQTNRQSVSGISKTSRLPTKLSEEKDRHPFSIHAVHTLFTTKPSAFNKFSP